ncbi:MAG: hypothetical protein D4S02_16685 [Rhodocyclaceae bacterium]|nr:MAG: hypothetical protein D4S02_16685 [Rhodocyclaceae bacterium]
MGYYGREYWTHPVSRFSQLKSILGDAVYDIRRTFLELNEQMLQRLLTVYGERHGDSAAKYARKTLPKWQSGAVTLSGQTMERLVELVPPFLAASARLSLLEKILQKNPTHPPTIRVKIDGLAPATGLAELDSALAGMRHTDPLAHLPPKVMQAATWLYADDITAARAMVAQIDARKNEAMRASAQKELDLLRRATVSGQVKNASYTVRMPAGTLEVAVVTPAPSIWKRLFG